MSLRKARATIKRGYIGRCLAAVSGALVAGTVGAQTPAADEVVLEEVLVTALRRGEGTALFSAVYTDERSDYAVPGFAYTSDAITVANLRLGLEGEAWSVFLTGENIFDEDGEVSQLATFIQAGGDLVRLRPQTWGVEATLNF